MHTYELIITSLPPIQTLEADLVQQGAHLGRDASSQHGHLSWLIVIYWAGSYLHTYYRTQLFSSHENEFAFLGEEKLKRNDIFDKLNIKKYLDPHLNFLLLVYILQIPLCIHRNCNTAHVHLWYGNNDNIMIISAWKAVISHCWQSCRVMALLLTASRRGRFEFWIPQMGWFRRGNHGTCVILHYAWMKICTTFLPPPSTGAPSSSRV